MDRDIVANALGAAAMRLLEQRLAKIYTVPQPAAGADWSIKVPGGVTWEVLSIKARLTTSAVVATRVVELQYTDGVNIIAGVGPVSAHAASLVGDYDYALDTAGTCQTSSRHAMSTALPYIEIPNGFFVQTSTVNMDAGDQWDRVALFVREWSESDVLQEMRMIAQSMTSQVMDEIYS